MASFTLSQLSLFPLTLPDKWLSITTSSQVPPVLDATNSNLIFAGATELYSNTDRGVLA